MDNPDLGLSRISKFLVDRDDMTVEEALARRQSYAVTLVCGGDVERSYTLQLAILTAANIANRCFPGAVRVRLDDRLAHAPLLLWPLLHQTFGQALVRILGPAAVGPRECEPGEHAVVFGNAVPPKGALRVTFDGWIAAAGPANTLERMSEREYCSLSGVLGAALAISELFFSFADISIEASRRTVALSLWRPDFDVHDPGALGIPVEVIAADLWVLGLGHLGNGYLWSLATLPFENPGAAEFFLIDFDKVERENVDTGLVFKIDKLGRYKTRACSEWLERRGFGTRLVERRFDGEFRCRRDEPQLALCGFDSNPARRDLARAGFLCVIESGLGGGTHNFDTISVHTLPNPRPAAELWPDISEEEQTKEIEQRTRVANETFAYARLNADACGRLELAGKSIAVPFVGAAASTLVVAEAIRLLHGGPACTDAKLALAALGGRVAPALGNYSAQDSAGIKFVDARLLSR